MSFKPSYEQILATWKDQIKGKDAVGMLSVSAQAFSGCNIHISVAIVDSVDYVIRKVENKAWRPRFKAYSDKEEVVRAMLIIKKEKTGPRQVERWELPHGQLRDFDVNINAALDRIVSASTGLHVNRVLGAPLAPQSWQSNGNWHYELLYVVLVNEVTSIDTLQTFAFSSLMTTLSIAGFAAKTRSPCFAIPTSASFSMPSPSDQKSGILPWTISP